MNRWLAVGLPLFLILSCENDPAEVAALNANLNTSVERAEDVKIIYSDSAIVRVTIEGPVMLSYLENNEPRQEFPEGVHVDFYGLGKQKTGELTALYGLRLERKGQVIVRDSVVWKSIDGEKLETEELIWDERTAKVFTQKFVRITRPDEIIYGYGLRANQDFSEARINAVQGRIKVDDPGEIKQ